jgi:hypothetical protein
LVYPLFSRSATLSKLIILSSKPYRSEVLLVDPTFRGVLRFLSAAPSWFNITCMHFDSAVSDFNDEFSSSQVSLRKDLRSVTTKNTPLNHLKPPSCGFKVTFPRRRTQVTEMRCLGLNGHEWRSHVDDYFSAFLLHHLNQTSRSCKEARLSHDSSGWRDCFADPC